MEAALLAASAATSSKHTKHAKGGHKKGLAIFDFILRLGAIAATLGATVNMGFFVIANAIVTSYLVLSIPFSIACTIRPHAVGPRLLLIITDTVMVALTTSAAASAAAIVYLAHNGSPSANWLAICQQFTDFCQGVSGAVVASVIAEVIFMLLVLLSALALRKSWKDKIFQAVLAPVAWVICCFWVE